MKKILITGKNSYIGTSVENWLMKEPDKYEVDTISLRSDSWENKDFSEYDVVFHVAGIAHIKEKSDNQDLYYKVNRDLAYETAKKAKEEGVGQFIFLSTMSVYGLENGVIDENTPLNPKSNYGKSKLQAEELIKPLEDDNFKVTILRPPMVYGKGCKGNYPKLVKLAKITPVFPDINNKRSMIYINNLSELIRLIIENEESGLFLPQNAEYVKTSDLVRLISEQHGKKVITIKLFNPLLKIIRHKVISKVFGSLYYCQSISKLDKGYAIYNFHESVIETEVIDNGYK